MYPAVLGAAVQQSTQEKGYFATPSTAYRVRAPSSMQSNAMQHRDTQNSVATFSYTAKSGTASEFSHGDRPPASTNARGACNALPESDMTCLTSESDARILVNKVDLWRFAPRPRTDFCIPFTIWTEAAWQES